MTKPTSTQVRDIGSIKFTSSGITQQRHTFVMRCRGLMR